MSREPQLRHPGLDSWSRVPPETLFAFCFCSYSLGRNIPLTTSQDKDLVPLLFPEVPPPHHCFSTGMGHTSPERPARPSQLDAGPCGQVSTLSLSDHLPVLPKRSPPSHLAETGGFAAASGRSQICLCDRPASYSREW